ncbi:MAG: tetratricopeptide repeat protein [Desulfovibrio sp.]|jgi:tetratricopeptide (TPR) repeat protein|nr:tetratricopeptide repeat protein [Desulfovibrio sp.]
MRHSGRAAPGHATGPVPPPSARLRTGLAPLLRGIAILLATAATAHAASTVTVPFGGGLRKESATVIARSAARLAALRDGMPALLEGSAASFAALAAHDPQRRLAVASAVLSTRVIAVTVEGYPPEVRMAVTVQADPPAYAEPAANAPRPAAGDGAGAAAGPAPRDDLPSDASLSPEASPDATTTASPPVPGTSDAVRIVLRNDPLLELHEEVLRREAALTEEALDAAQATARHVARHGGEDESPFAQRLGALARSLEALDLYRACLSGIPADTDVADGRTIGRDPASGPTAGQSADGLPFPSVSTMGATVGGWGLAPEAMLRHMRRAVALDARNPLLWNALGEALLLLDRPQDAMEAQDRALKLSPGFARALHARAVCHLRLQMPALAVADASAAIRLRPDVAAHWRVRGAAWQVRGEPGPMCDDFYRACALGDCEGLSLARGRGLCRPPTDGPAAPRADGGSSGNNGQRGQNGQDGRNGPSGTGSTAAPAAVSGIAPAATTEGAPDAARNAPQDAVWFNEHVPVDSPSAMAPPPVSGGTDATVRDAQASPPRDPGREASLYELPDDSPAPRTLP